MRLILALGIIGVVLALPRHDETLHSLAERQLPAGDPCGRLAGTTPYYAPRTILACMQSISFKSAARDNIMNVANAMYTELDVLAANQLGDTEAPVNQGINIQAEFQRINGTSYTSDFDFQCDLSRSLQLLNDGHHAWSSCYRSLFVTTHAIPIVSLSSDAESTSPNIYISPDVAQFVAAAGFTALYFNAGINVASLAGAQVLGIEGKPAWDYIEQDKLPVTGIYLDKQQRLNSVFASYIADGGVWSRIPGRFTSTRDWTKNNITMTLKLENGENKEIVIPWVVRWGGKALWNYKTGEEFYTANCAAARPITVSDTSGPVNSTQAPPMTTRPTEADLNRVAQSAYRACPIASSPIALPVSTTEDPTKSTSYLGGRDVMFFSIPNTKNGVVYLPTFLPDPASNACVTRYFIDLVFGLRNFTAAGIENVLIDTSNNGGGAIVLSQVAQVLFTGQKFENEANFETVLKRTPLTELFLKQFIDKPSLSNLFSTFNPNTYRNGSNYFTPGREYTINNQILRTSNLLRDSTEQIDLLDMLFDIPDAAPYPPKNIVFTGNGLCGSACATFTNFLIEYYNGTGFIQAAQPSKPIEFTSFMAGQAFTSEAVYKEAAAMGLRENPLLPILDHAGSFGFAIRAAISPIKAPGEFLQYRSFPAEKRFALTKEHYLDQIKSWTYIASKAFPRNL